MFTTARLLEALKLRVQLPDSQGEFTDDELLLLADEEMRTTLLAAIRQARADYYVKFVDTPIVSGQRDYRIPSRTQAGGLRDIILITPSGSGLNVPQIHLEDTDVFANAGSYFWPGGIAYAFQGDLIRLSPDAQSTGYTLRIRYFLRQNRLVLESACAQVRNIAGAVVTCVNVPATITNATPTDLIQANPNFDTLGLDVTPNAVVPGAGGTITYASAADVPADLQVGDFISLAGESCVPQVPEEWHTLLVSATSVRILEALGDRQGVQIAQGKMQEQLNAIRSLLEPRSEGASKKVLNRYSPLRFNRNRGW